MKKRVLARSEYWMDERRLADATAGLRRVKESVSLTSFDIAHDSDGERCAIDAVEAQRCPSAELVYGVWEETKGEYADGRLYNGVALGLSALAGAMTGAGWYRFLPLDWNSVGLEYEALGGRGFQEMDIDGLKGCDASAYANYVRSDGKLLVPSGAYAAIWRCVDVYADDDIALENFAKRSADDAIKILSEYWARVNDVSF